MPPPKVELLFVSQYSRSIDSINGKKTEREFDQIKCHRNYSFTIFWLEHKTMTLVSDSKMLALHANLDLYAISLPSLFVDIIIRIDLLDSFSVVFHCNQCF